jgi:hyperosmotically inducible periplasmic protein
LKKFPGESSLEQRIHEDPLRFKEILYFLLTAEVRFASKNRDLRGFYDESKDFYLATPWHTRCCFQKCISQRLIDLSRRRNLRTQFFSGGNKMKTRALLFSASLLVGGFLVPLGSSSAQTDAGLPPAADNSAMNQRDQGHETLTPMDQSSKPTDVKMTREIRRAIVKDDQLSMDAKNIKIITVDGAVTLRGPVKTEQEKADIAAKAAQLAGDSNVHDELEVAGQ